MTSEPPDPSRLSREAMAFGHKPAEFMPADREWGPDLPGAFAAPDERWQNLLVGTKADLEDVVREFEVHDRMPEKVGRMLLTSRQLFVHSYFAYEFAFVAAVWSMFGLEAALKDVLEPSDDDWSSLTELIGKAQARSWLTSDEGEQIRGGAKMRNAFVHARAQGTFTPGAAASVLEASHYLVSKLYERASP